jgi:hypothetical protein
MKQWTKPRGVILILLLLFAISCAVSKIKDHRELRQHYKDVNAFLHNENLQEPFFKIHLKNGNVALINAWELNTSGDSLIGDGQLFDFNRIAIDSGTLAFSIESMAIIETNNYEEIKSKDKDRISALAVLTGINIAGAIACLTNPKACFGSCPTFYISNETDLHQTRAEGFSNAIAPSLENRDIDALRFATTEEVFRVYMKNEAYETHVVNQVELWTVPRKTNEVVLVDETDQFYVCSSPEPATQAATASEVVTSLLADQDEKEYFSLTDSNDLTRKEDLFIDFHASDQQHLGMAISFRQTLLTTFLLYQGLSWMGDDVGDYFSKMEKSKVLRKNMDKPFRMLGDIECYIWDEKKGDWHFVQRIHETGPIAKNLQVIIFPEQLISIGQPVRVKLTMARGLWRVDYVGLTAIKEKVTPHKVTLSKLVSLKKINNHSVDQIADDDEQYLVTFPGDEYMLEFRLPQTNSDEEHELFVAAKGYYMEWIRSDWLSGKDPKKIRRLLSGNKATWQSLAREYKAVEPEMESIFWNSKFYEPQN